MKEQFIVTRYKSAAEVSWLKDIHVTLVDKYYHEIPTEHDYEVGDAIQNSLGQSVGEIINILENEKGTYALVQLIQHVNFDSLIQLGIPFENMIFDMNHWNYNKDVDIIEKKVNSIE